MKNSKEDYPIKIAQWLEEVRFRKKFFGGLDEADVWKKIEELNRLYESALETERIRYDTLIEHYRERAMENHNSEMGHDE